MLTEIKVLSEQTKEIRVLYVEDERTVREQTIMIFDILFQSVDVAVDGEDGWQKYQNSQYDIVFTDISMPKMDGLKLTKLIKENNPMQKVVIISAYNITDYLLKAIELGVDGFLLKPIKMDKTVLLIRKLAESILAGRMMQGYRKKLEEEINTKTQVIHQQTVTDKLTGLQNRFALNKALKNTETDTVLILLNIDNFDSINVVYGYEIGDKSIVFLAKLLTKNRPPHSSLFYLGNDEFALTCKLNENALMAYAKKLQNIIAESVIKLYDIDIKFTVTMAIAKGDDKLLKHAYIALKEAKKQGRNIIKIYSQDLLIEKLQAQIQKYSPIIRDAIKNDCVVPYFQPIVDNKTHKVYKYECLARIVNAEKTYSPFEFINIAEIIGLIPEITKIMIDKSFQIFKHNKFDFSINITERDLHNNYLKEYFLKKLLQYNIEPSRVILEVLEGISATGAQNSLEQLMELKNIGFSIAIDDFGAQNSNFERVHAMNIDFIKIDGSFVKNIDTNAKSYSIVKTMTDFAKSIGAKVIAEYVHSQEVAYTVETLGIEYSQGYYFYEPKPHLSTEDTAKDTNHENI
ncbi:EAL domain-containing protein [Sulfurimonas hydrogeniphila]|uniref:EAL domain-containing protein n=1 Tax=Sulfurimonas hydrogeniphila TaxID=2509341 RepID=UPI00165F8699|nr:EAL domain-containing response regulator [Sulfurimonas hydrogeniphila]